ncbi:MAG TPA: SIS domain-containing protein [Anseongella sp.]
MQSYFHQYLEKQKAALDSVPLPAVEQIVEKFREALTADRQLFMMGNGGNASNASHFVTDLGKGASDKTVKRFRCLSLNDNVSWMTAIGNDYRYEDVFMRQLTNYANAGDILFALSVSGNSPNIVTAAEWARKKGLYVISIAGAKEGAITSLADLPIVIKDTHYGRVEDIQMTICHMVCYAFMELEE